MDCGRNVAPRGREGAGGGGSQVLSQGYGVDEATWESCSAFLLLDGRLNSVVVEYLSQNSLGELLRLAELLADKA